MATIASQTLISSISGTEEFLITIGGVDYKCTAAQITAEVVNDLASEIASTNADITNLDSTKLNKAGGTLTGALTLSGDATGSLHATTKQQMDTADALKANIASPTFTGTPLAPTAADGTSTTQLATTAFVLNQLDEYVFERTAVTSSPKTLTEDEAGIIDVNVAGAVTINLPTISALSNPKRVFYRIKDSGFNANATTQIITINRGGSDTIENAATSVTITTAGEDVYLYNDGSTSWYLSNVDTAASTTAAGVIELATDTEAKALTDTTRALTASNLDAVLNDAIFLRTAVGTATFNATEAMSGILGVTYTATGAVTLNLPAISGLTRASACVYEIQDEGASAGTNKITITPNGSETINGASTLVINNNNQGAFVYNDGTNWFAKVASVAAPTLASVLASGNSTGAKDIILTNGQQIKSSAGSVELDFNSTSYQITTDAGVYGDGSSWLFGSSANSSQLGLGNGGGAAAFADAAIGFGVYPDGGGASNGNTFSVLVQMNNATNASTPNIDNPAIIIGSKNSTVNSGVYNSVIVAGSGITATTASTLYTSNINVATASTLTGAVTMANKVIFSGIETIAAGGTSTALSLTKTLHSIDADAGGDIFTLADGTIGQIMTIACLSATGVCTITPTNLSGGTSVTLNAAGETVILQFVDTNWYIMGGNAYTVI